MSDVYLDFRNHPRVIDFLQEGVPYAEGPEGEAAAKLVQVYEDGGKLSTSTLVDAARKLGKAIWPARQALQRWIKQEASEHEWDQLIAALRPSTSHIVSRLRKLLEVKHVDELLAHPESDIALKLEDREEIQQVREQLFLDTWKKQHEHLRIYIEEAQIELRGYIRRFDMLRDLASELPPSFSSEIISKIEHYEDRVFFQFETLSMEMLDDEIRYYTDQKEITPFEDAV
ncbi:hypothetical protein IT408_00530 [Candidatus Uhrbacteria bacterium]|nr:hypothetical protein [Candidatus Uhrbacteria bacterium]